MFRKAKTHLQIGKLLFQYSKSQDQIRFHLLKAKELGSRLRSPNEYIKYEAADILADLHEKASKRLEAICVLSESIQVSNNNPYWHCRLLFKLSQLLVADGDVHSACERLTMGAEYAQLHNSAFTKSLFILSKALVSLPICSHLSSAAPH
ncbi:mau2 chromatid cohesion factor [Cichlidogyrus casuarinus]|uniref:Cohesin loading complex subunit SCC4 homolog n=1 Tax=Cichlidogyrus casuarinus TaxID=1844966 RepID=A0ABD2QGW5_9PLAT